MEDHGGASRSVEDTRDEEAVERVRGRRRDRHDRHHGAAPPFSSFGGGGVVGIEGGCGTLDGVPNERIIS